ncbi:hypothetical protein [Clostridium hydrogeniformans]|uniref:hypothetical protein n=1 Tax=Clostridium hydrogeniformans TaxID=349933 RepID=UPI0004822095|nr:hypothetical protein [Clostridium hydrogeniformans]
MNNSIKEKTIEEIRNCMRIQKELCEEKGYPNFAPSSGTCWKCNRNIYQSYQIRERKSIGETGERLVTGCPHCFRSYCD